jgi:NADH dehydrogenase
VIVGGGFGGLYAARALADAPVRVTLVDRRNHHLFQPLLYQVATAALSPADIAQPIRSILRRQANAEVILGEVSAIDPVRREVVVDHRDHADTLGYDFLILATGAGHAYFGHDDWASLAPGLKSLEDALEIRRRILLAFEEADREEDPARQQALLTFIVVGGGPTGVELAGAIAEIAHQALAADFDNIDPTAARVVLVEAGNRLLSTFPASLGRRATSALDRLGVEVRLGRPVTEIVPGRVRIGSDAISAGTVLWAAGVRASPLGAILSVPLDRVGRVLVAPDLSVPGHPEIFVVGDLAALTDEHGQQLPGTAPVAIQEGRYAAGKIVSAVNGEAARPFRYRVRGNLATVGRNSAVVDLGRVRLWGFPAWLVWAVVHVFNLIGFRNRLLVAIQWLWLYLTFQRGARLITESPSSRH